MKKLYALCFMTIAVVAADILLFRGSVVQAQSGMIIINRVEMIHSRSQTHAQGNVVGFSCVGDASRASILSELGIEPDDVESFSLADMTPIKRETGQAAFTFRGRTRTSPVMFGEEGDATLFGVMTLGSLGLMLDPVKQEVRKMRLRV